jgi:hypothetical protein
MLFFFFYDLKLEPGFPGQFHFGIQQQPPVLLIGGQHAPEIQGIAGVDGMGVGPAPAQAHASQQLVEHAPHMP